eukprot:157944-Prorocentrum_minimum.AAC.2
MATTISYRPRAMFSQIQYSSKRCSKFRKQVISASSKLNRLPARALGVRCSSGDDQVRSAEIAGSLSFAIINTLKRTL